MRRHAFATWAIFCTGSFGQALKPRSQCIPRPGISSELRRYPSIVAEAGRTMSGRLPATGIRIGPVELVMCTLRRPTWVTTVLGRLTAPRWRRTVPCVGGASPRNGRPYSGARRHIPRTTAETAGHHTASRVEHARSRFSLTVTCVTVAHSRRTFFDKETGDADGSPTTPAVARNQTGPAPLSSFNLRRAATSGGAALVVGGRARCRCDHRGKTWAIHTRFAGSPSGPSVQTLAWRCSSRCFMR
jgi:hypothetical protein